jgi:hypothetical protein
MVTVLFAILAFALVAPALAGDSEVTGLLGGKSFSEGRLDDAGVNGSFQLGVKASLDFDWPISIALDLVRAAGDSTEDVSGAFPLSVKTEVESLEFDFGVRKYFLDAKPVRPYVGGGLGFVTLNVKQVESGSFGPGTSFSDVVVDDSGSGLGLWIDGGFGYFVKSVVLGVDLRYSNASSKVTPKSGGGVKLDTGGLQYAFFVGYRW